MMKRHPIIVIAGPTAVGKSALGIALAKEWGGEIISMDSMQVYRGLNIGTAKIMPEEMEGIPHHLLDIVNPEERFTVEQYQRLAYQTIREIEERGKLPILLGGTGLYMDAVLKGFRFAESEENLAYRKRLEGEMETHGEEALLEKLKKRDPRKAASLHPGDRKKIIRALEVLHETGQPMSQREKAYNSPPDLAPFVIVLERSRESLYRMVNERVEKMVGQGLIEEVLGLVRCGKLPPSSQASKAIGYREVVWLLRGWVTKQEMVRLIQKHSRNYAKRQITWFHKDPKNHFYNVESLTTQEIQEQLHSKIQNFLQKGNEGTC